MGYLGPSATFVRRGGEEGLSRPPSPDTRAQVQSLLPRQGLLPRSSPGQVPRSIDRGVLANQMFSEIIFGCDANPVSNLKTLRHCHATDCKSLFDAASAANFNTEEKRVGLTIRAVQETIAPQDMRWVPTTAMWADGLTKVSDSLRETFRNW